MNFDEGVLHRRLRRWVVLADGRETRMGNGAGRVQFSVGICSSLHIISFHLFLVSCICMFSVGFQFERTEVAC
jgi:hypothetical protein